MKIVQERDIQLNTRLNLVKVEAAKRVATFEVLDEAAKPTGETRQFEVSSCFPGVGLLVYWSSHDKGDAGMI